MIEAKPGYTESWVHGIASRPRRKLPSLLRSDVEFRGFVESWLICRGVGRPEFLDLGSFSLSISI